MKKTSVNNYYINCCLLALFLFSSAIYAQSEATTKPMSFNIAKEVKPPLWQIVQQPQFVDADGNNAIDASEKCKIVMQVKNIGMGDGMGLTAKISAVGTTSGITYSNAAIPAIKVGQTATVEFPLSTNMNTADGDVTFTFYVDEPMGFSTDKFSLKIKTRQFQAPRIEVVDYAVTGDNGGVLEKMKPFTLQLLLQNTQYGLGENVSVTLQYPNNVYNASGQDTYNVDKINAGETKTINYQLFVNNVYEGTSIPLTVKINEKYGKYAQNKNITLTLNQQLASNKTVEVAAQVAQRPDIVTGQLRADVDKNIPATGKSNTHGYAIIIGNEDYHSYQNGLSSEQDVPFASNDANIFKQYCVKTLGIPDNNISLLTNATAAKMNQEIDFITRLAARDDQAEIIFYYAGHGFPDENTKQPYLIPVDVTASNLASAIDLYALYAKLSQTNARVTVFLDACFSGGGRDAGLLAARGVKVTPKKDALSGSLVVFSATSADQTALPYAENYHGMFTYFLLKKLQESQGACTYTEMYDYLSKNVGDNSLRVNRKDQNPEVNTSAKVQENWRNWRFD